MSQQKPITLIIEAKDGSKYQGHFISKDTEKLTITLSDVTKTFEGKEEKLLSYEIKKEDITKISMIENIQQKEEVNNINEIPENKKPDDNLENVQKAYDKSKDSFFDNLTMATNSDMQKVSDIYNKKNADTFKLQENSNNNRNNRGRGRGRFRGRGRGNRGGYIQPNKFNFPYNNNNNYGYQQQNNYNQNGYWHNNFRNNQGYNNYNHRGRGNYAYGYRNNNNRGRGQNNGNFQQNNSNQ